MPIQSFDERTIADLALLASLPQAAAEEFARIAVEFTLKGAKEKPFVQAANNLNDRDLVASIAAAELPETSLAALTSNYKSARAEMRELAKAGITQLPSFQGFDWRLDIEMSRRGAHHVAQPVYMLRVDSVSGHSVAADASAAAASPMGASSMYLQSDYANLAQLHDSLSAALEESTTQHASRVERYIR